MKKSIDNGSNAAAADSEQLQRITTQLDSDVNALDGSTQSRLNQARAAAIAQASVHGTSQRAADRFRWQWPAAAFAAALALVAVYPALQPGEEEAGAAVA
ncbi:MAG: hypothetical protein HKO07_06750, partial [Pseudomonadales bacterium]|nr:hypothetical protein [Pseudomonadales bacterium]